MSGWSSCPVIGESCELSNSKSSFRSVHDLSSSCYCDFSRPLGELSVWAAAKDFPSELPFWSGEVHRKYPLGSVRDDDDAAGRRQYPTILHDAGLVGSKGQQATTKQGSSSSSSRRRRKSGLLKPPTGKEGRIPSPSFKSPFSSRPVTCSSAHAWAATFARQLYDRTQLGEWERTEHVNEYNQGQCKGTAEAKGMAARMGSVMYNLLSGETLRDRYFEPLRCAVKGGGNHWVKPYWQSKRRHVSALSTPPKKKKNKK